MKYKVILIDPPWSYKDKALAGNRGACCKYPVLSLGDIKALPINSIAEDDCALFLWITMPQLPIVFEVIKAWNFNYKTVAFTWVKRNKKSPSYFWGMGSWTRACAELCLLATRGKPKRMDAGVHSIVDTPVEFHSKKPSIVRDNIVKLMGDINRIELFAREKVEGWDCIGNEIDGKDIRESLKEIADIKYLGRE